MLRKCIQVTASFFLAVTISIIMPSTTVAQIMLSFEIKRALDSEMTSLLDFDPKLGPEAAGEHAKLMNINAFEKDYLRKASPSENKRLAMVGRISTDDKVLFRKNGKLVKMRVGGTAIMISPCLGITAYHVFFGQSKNPSKEFVAHFESQGESIAARAISYGEYQENDFASDHVLFELDPKKCTGQFGYMDGNIIREAFIKLTDFDTAGFPTKYNDQKNSDQRWIHNGCRITETDISFVDRTDTRDGVYTSNCTVWDGQSGGPIYFSEGENGKLRIIAMNVAANKGSEEVYAHYSHDKANIAIPVHRVLSYGNNLHHIRKDRQRFPDFSEVNR